MSDVAERAQKVLVLFAHPAQNRSEVNVHLAEAAHQLDHVTLIDLYGEYPRLDIDIDLEQARLREHDVIIFLHPLYWYSTPAILKEWQDLVLEYGFAYGKGGTALEGKTFFSAVTTGGSAEAYRDNGYNRFTIRELLQPLEQTANLCGMTYLAPLVLFGARSAKEHGRVSGHVALFRRLLEALVAEKLPLIEAAKAETLNVVLQKHGMG